MSGVYTETTERGFKRSILETGAVVVERKGKIVSILKKHITKEEKLELMRQLRQEGYSYIEIGEVVGYSAATVSLWLNKKKSGC